MVEMKVIDCDSAELGEAPAMVVVGVKFDGESRELLTWALVKAARPGDRVIALHVLDTFTESTSSLLSLVKTFDSIMAVYEGFCNLKQVDLKLKICRGSSVKKILVREARSSGAAKVVVGTSKSRHTIRSSASVAKYCAKKLSKTFGVFAVENGKVVFQREASGADAEDLQGDNNMGKKTKVLRDVNSTKMLLKAHKKYGDCRNISTAYGGKRSAKCSICDSASRSLIDSYSQSLEELPGEGNVVNSLALVPIELTVEASGSELIVGKSTESKRGWSLLRQMFFPRWLHEENSGSKKKSVMHRVLGLPSSHSSAVIHPDQKQNCSDLEGQASNLNRESGAIVAVGNHNMWPLSSCDGFDGLPKELQGLHERYSSTCRLFSYQELLEATSNFAPENVVGKGGSSYVYKGCLADGKELAVKILKPSEYLVKEFVSEIEIITTLSHKNIVSLVGFCYEDSKLILVYDFLSRGNLEENLHGHKKDVEFGWQKRYKVAVGIVEALDHLHNSCTEPVIHGDVKSSNILLSDDFEPQLSDFGLASWGSSGSCHTNGTDVAGTFGYLAPEYFMHGKVSDKIDVYALGVVLLELISGRKPIDNECAKGEESLVMWARPILRDGKISEILDPAIGSKHDVGCIENMVLAVTLCLKRSPKLRPQISLVLKILKGDQDATRLAQQQVGTSEEIDFFDDEIDPSNIQSHLNLALLDLEDDSVSVSSNEQTVSMEDYLQGRWSRSSSFDKKC